MGQLEAELGRIGNAQKIASRTAFSENFQQGFDVTGTYRHALFEDSRTSVAGGLGVGAIPLVGEGYDVVTLFHPDSTLFDRAMSAGSLAVNAVTAGLSPNYGALKGAGQAIAEHADEAADVGKNVANASQEALKQAPEGLDDAMCALENAGGGLPRLPGGDIPGLPLILGRIKSARDKLRQALDPHNYPVDAEAHHLFGVELFDTPLGKQLQDWGIDLNGAANGVYLPKYDYAGRLASLHRGRTAGAYTEEVTRRLESAASKDDAIAILNKIRDDLLNGRLKINGAE